LNRARVLLADDHLEMSKSIASLLELDFEIVSSVTNGPEMLAEASRLTPDIIILDISMPGLDGITAAERLRSNGSSAKVVFLTVHEDSEFVQACLAAGALGYVFKRRLTSDLITAIYEAIEGRSFISKSMGAKNDNA
jgi:DNA-binding NarL/FixJ family response regulator